MELRRILLRIILWSLGIAAVLGAMAVLTGGRETLWRVSATTALTAVAAALLMPVSLLLDQSKSRPAGVLGTALVVIEFLLGLALIWNMTQYAPVAAMSEKVALTMTFLAVCGVPAMAFLRTLRTSYARAAAPLGLAFSALSFTLMMFGVWAQAQPFMLEEWPQTAGLVGGLGLLTATCLLNLTADEAMWLRMVRVGGALASLLAMTIAIYAVWKHIHEDNGLVTTLISCGAVVTHYNLARLCPLTSGQAWVRWAAVGAIIATALCVDLLAVKVLPQRDIFERGAGAAGVIAACASMALIVLARINRRIVEPGREMEAIRDVQILCAGCGRKQRLPIGRSACPACRVRYEIRVEEPRCVTCGYLLFQLTSPRCPECDTAVDEGWTAPPAAQTV